MKKLSVLIIIFTISLSLFSHPAKEVKASYNAETKILTVEFEHPVRNADDHFIFECKIKVNKKDIVTQMISKQETPEGGVLLYKIIDLKPGDKVKVMTNCNKSGKKSTTITI